MYDKAATGKGRRCWTSTYSQEVVALGAFSRAILLLEHIHFPTGIIFRVQGAFLSYNFSRKPGEVEGGERGRFAGPLSPDKTLLE